MLFMDMENVSIAGELSHLRAVEVAAFHQHLALHSS